MTFSFFDHVMRGLSGQWLFGEAIVMTQRVSGLLVFRLGCVGVEWSISIQGGHCYDIK